MIIPVQMFHALKFIEMYSQYDNYYVDDFERDCDLDNDYPDCVERNDMERYYEDKYEK